MVGTYRRHIGPHFSEGARLLWLKLPQLARAWGIKPESAREELTKRLGAARGTVARYLYGDRKPDRTLASKLQELAGIPAEAWDQAPKQEFRLKATGTEG